MTDVIIRRDKDDLRTDEEIKAEGLRKITAMSDDERLGLGYDKCLRRAEIPDEKKALHAKRDKLRFGVPDVAELDRIEKRLTALSEEEDALMGQSSEGLDVFKGITASKLTVRLLRKDGHSLPDSVELSAMDKKRIVLCKELGLAGQRNILNREGLMMFALAHKVPPKNRRGKPMTIKSISQAMTKLRKIFREKVGIMDKEPFHPKKAGWQPRFKLIDAIEKADKRKADRAVHVPYDDTLQYDQENDAAGELLREYYKKLPS